MNIGLLQLKCVVGDFKSNLQKLLAYLREAERQDCQLVIAPELALSGYPPQDLLFHPRFVEDHNRVLEELKNELKNFKCELILGAFEKKAPQGRLSNCALWLAHGEKVASQEKSLLPNYDVFDESRYFQAAQNNAPFPRFGMNFSLSVCEDMWTANEFSAHHEGQALLEQHQKSDCIVSLNASPYHGKKHASRLQVAQTMCSKLKAPLIYVNQVGVVDHLLFDGQSFVMNAKGTVIHQLPAFEECFHKFDFNELSRAKEEDIANVRSELPEMLDGITFGIREYVQQNKIKGVVLGLSGGIDSALVAVLAAKALGPQAVHAIAMPGPFNKNISLEDARQLAQQLGTQFHEISIETILKTTSELLGKKIERLEELVTYENLQSRLRGVILMTYANAHNLVVVNTGNKSEIATGYCTLYGDTNGAFSPIGDLLKTEVFEACRQINAEGELIPQRIIDRPPSAELRPDQEDQQSLPPYEVLDQIIQGYIVGYQDAASISKQHGLDQALVEKWLLTIEGAEFKRKQLPFCFRVSRRAFDSGRRVPIMKNFPQATL